MNKTRSKETNFDNWFAGIRNFFFRNRRFTVITRLFLYFSLVVTFFFLGLYAWVYSSIPSRSTFYNLKNYTSSEVYSKDGQLLGKYFLQDRTNVPLEKISPHVINALISTEDVRFYYHNGIDKRGMMRVFFKSLLLGDESSGGGSTITQQLAKNLFPRKRFRFFSMPVNKLREAITAEKLEDVFSKEDILSLYLNTVPFGENAFGIEVASKRYFSKSASDLSVEEAATLVGMLKATTSYNPKRHPEASKNRRNVVLEQMSKYGYLKSEQKDSIKNLPLKLKYKYLDHNQGYATYFREHLRQELAKWCSTHRKEDGTPYNLYTDGLKIYTSIDSRMQKYAEEAVAAHMKKLQQLFYEHWGKQNPWGNSGSVVEDAVKRSVRYKELKAAGFSEREIKKAFATPVKTKVFSWSGEQVKALSPLDSIKYYLKFLHTGFVAIDPKTGLVKAWVGGLNHEYFKYDHVNTHAKRQVGSTFKPIVYATALEEGVQPCDYFENEKVVYEAYNNWSPGNADGKYGGKYSMLGALTQSVNTVSAQLIMKAGIKNVIDVAQRMGINSHLEPVPSLALGTADISLLEMVSAYGVFPNNGYHVKPKYILRIEAADGTVLEDFSRDTEKNLAISPLNAAIITKMMENVVNKGTGLKLRSQYNFTLPIAGKTGTTQSHADGWFIGFTPDLVAGAWVGAEDRRVHFRSLSLGQGSNMALPIWGEFMKRVLKDPAFQNMQKSKFPEISSETITLDCEPYIEPKDSLSIWDLIFGPAKTDSAREAERIQEREQRKQEKRRQKESSDGFFNIFKKRRY